MAGIPQRSPGVPGLLDPGRAEVRRLAELLGRRPLSLADYHAVGEQLRRLAGDPVVASLPAWRDQVARAVGVSASTLNKALQFRREYEAKDLADLEELGVGWARLTSALALKGRRRRHALLKRARAEGWDDRGVQRAVQRLKGSRRGGGRPRKGLRSHGLLADLAELARLAALWAAFHEQVWAANREGYAGELKGLPAAAREAMRRHLDEARQGLGALRRRCGEALAGLRTLARE